MDTYYYTTHDGRDVELEWGSDEMTVWTTGHSREKIGSFEFRFIEGPSGRGDDDYFHLTHMFLEGPPSAPNTYRRQGIGREIISIVGAVTFSPNDGMRRDDGSHLTGDGAIFAAAMVKAKLAHWSSGDDEDWEA